MARIIRGTSYLNVYKYLFAEDAGLILYNNSFSSAGRSPTKLGEYWATGIRTFAPYNVGDLNTFFENETGGIQYHNFSEEEYTIAIHSFFKKN